MKTLQLGIYFATISELIIMVALYPLSWISLVIVGGCGLIPSILIRPQIESYNPTKMLKTIQIIAQLTISVLMLFLCAGSIYAFITSDKLVETLACYFGTSALIGAFLTILLITINDGLPQNYFKYSIISILIILGIMICNIFYYFIDLQIPTLENVFTLCVWISIIVFILSLVIQFIKDIKHD